MAPIFMSAPPLQQAMRDLAATSRHMTPVLAELAKHRAPVAISQLADKLGLESGDVLRALIALEMAGLAETTHYRVTDSGVQAAKE